MKDYSVPFGDLSYSVQLGRKEVVVALQLWILSGCEILGIKFQKGHYEAVLCFVHFPGAVVLHIVWF